MTATSHQSDSKSAISQLDSKYFAGGIVACQAFVIVLTWALGFTYATDIGAMEYGFFRDVSIMIFFGFGFLMTFLYKNGLTAIGGVLMISTLVVELSLIAGFLLNNGQEARDKHPDGKFEVKLHHLTEGLFAAGTVMISFGAVLGKVTPFQLLVMAVIEVFAFWANFRLACVEIGAHDVGGGLVIHTFGAYFGLAATWFVSKQGSHDHQDEKPLYSSDLFSLAGTAFLFILWPSFQSAVTTDPARQFMAISNTFISLCSSTLAFAALSRFVSDKKYAVDQLQNAVLAGGVMMGCVGDMDMGFHGAMISGFLAGAVSTYGFARTPVAHSFHVAHCGIHDTCGVNNLHGIPGIMSAILSIIVVAALGNGCEDCSQAAKGFPGVTALTQLYALLVTVCMAIVCGLLAGVAMTMPLKPLGLDLPDSMHFGDDAFFHMANHLDNDEEKQVSGKSGDDAKIVNVKESDPPADPEFTL